MKRIFTRLTGALAAAMLAGCDAALYELPAPAAVGVSVGRHCPHCGRIESKREVAASVYEYTLRMPDGTSSVFQETLPASWRVGERVGVIAGLEPALN